MANKSIDHKLVKISNITQETKDQFKTLGLGLICNIGDLIYIIGDPDTLLISGPDVTFQKGDHVVTAKEINTK